MATPVIVTQADLCTQVLRCAVDAGLPSLEMRLRTRVLWWSGGRVSSNPRQPSSRARRTLEQAGTLACGSMTMRRSGRWPGWVEEGSRVGTSGGFGIDAGQAVLALLLRRREAGYAAGVCLLMGRPQRTAKCPRGHTWHLLR